jgi:hypothetical protein
VSSWQQQHQTEKILLQLSALSPLVLLLLLGGCAAAALLWLLLRKATTGAAAAAALPETSRFQTYHQLLLPPLLLHPCLSQFHLLLLLH